MNPALVRWLQFQFPAGECVFRRLNVLCGRFGQDSLPPRPCALAGISLTSAAEEILERRTCPSRNPAKKVIYRDFCFYFSQSIAVEVPIAAKLSLDCIGEIVRNRKAERSPSVDDKYVFA